MNLITEYEGPVPEEPKPKSWFKRLLERYAVTEGSPNQDMIKRDND